MTESRFGPVDCRARREPTVSVISFVGDDPAALNAVKGFMRSAGYSCSFFASADAILASNRLHESDCMVVDVQMAGMSGRALQIRLREMMCGIPIVFVTAYSDDAIRQNVLDDGAAGFLRKPFTHEALLNSIRSGMDRAARSPEHMERRLRHALAQSQDEYFRAVREQKILIAEVPSGLPAPDGCFRIEQAGKKRRVALDRLGVAIEAMNDFIKSHPRNI